MFDSVAAPAVLRFRSEERRRGAARDEAESIYSFEKEGKKKEKTGDGASGGST